jgi:hypothetical protein
MKEPEKIPLNPSTPKAKEVKKIRMPYLYPEPIMDDLCSSSDLQKHLEQINQILDESANENNSENHS